MSNGADVHDSVRSFADSCNENKQLMSMIAGWNRTIHVISTDVVSHATLKTNAGTVTMAPDLEGTPDLIIQSDTEILAKVFYGEVSPNEPYNDGTLRIVGSESDIVKLDFITAMLWD